MSSPRPGSPGATRSCPHCRATILESAPVCPACRHHLRFDASPPDQQARTALLVEGRLGPDGATPVEYTMVLSIRDERGAEVGRHVVGVGALAGSQSRTFSVSVEVREPPAKPRR